MILPSCFRERSTLFKHRSAEFYDSASSYVAPLLTDVPLSILEACLLAVVSYFLAGMRVRGPLPLAPTFARPFLIRCNTRGLSDAYRTPRSQNDAGYFFYFLFVLVALESAGGAHGRLLCALCQMQVTANSASSIVILRGDAPC